jgi:hypothetical protein
MSGSNIKSDLSQETLTVENLPSELKEIIEQRAHNAGLTTVPVTAIGGFAMHYGLEYAFNSLMASDIGKIGIDGTLNTKEDFQNAQRILTGGLLAFEMLNGWLTYGIAKDQQYAQLATNYIQQWDKSEHLLSSPTELSGRDNFFANLQAIVGGGIASAAGYFASLGAEKILEHQLPENVEMDHIIPSQAIPWVTAATIGTVAFLSGRNTILNQRMEEINRERTDISFVKRLQEERSNDITAQLVIT